MTKQIYSEAFADGAEFLRAVVMASSDYFAREVDRRLEYSASAFGANEELPKEGGFLVAPEEFVQTLWSRVLDTGALLSRTRRIPVIRSDGAKLPAIDERSRTDGSRWGGVQSAWVDAGETVSETRPEFRSMTLKPHKQLAIAYATDELLGDTPALAGWFELAFTDEVVHTLEQAIINGTGAGRPLGVLNAGALITVQPESGQSAATVLPQNLLNMTARLWSSSHRRGLWLMGNDAFAQIADASFSNGSPVVTTGADGTRRILQMGVELTEHTPSLGSAGDVLLLDLSQYAVAERERDFVSSIHVRFIWAEMTFRIRYRVDGQPLWLTPLTPKNSSTTQSAFISLAARS